MDDSSRQASANRHTRDAWERCAEHRRKVTDMVLSSSTTQGDSLCVLGAGNLNDLAIDKLRDRFDEVHLVDLDREAVEWGLSRQRWEGPPLRIHAPVDLSEVTPDIPPQGVVLSAGVMSQMFETLENAREAPGDYVESKIAMRRRHFAQALELTRPGGTFLLVSDLVSSLTAPQLMTTPAAELTEEMWRLVSQRNFFTGTNPVAVCDDLRELSAAKGGAWVELHDPWLWPITADRTYLTYAVAVRRASESPSGSSSHAGRHRFPG